MAHLTLLNHEQEEVKDLLDKIVHSIHSYVNTIGFFLAILCIRNNIQQYHMSSIYLIQILINLFIRKSLFIVSYRWKSSEKQTCVEKWNLPQLPAILGGNYASRREDLVDVFIVLRC